MIEKYKDDKSSIISIVPFDIFDFKPGLYPGSYRIPACKDNRKPQVLVIGPSEHLMSIGGRRDPVRVLTPSYEIAASIIRDFLGGQLWTEAGVATPGIDWIQGSTDAKMFIEDHTDMYDNMVDVQKKWFLRICKQTDNEWGRYKNYRVVSDQARFAARFLGLDPEWMTVEDVGSTYKKCPMCSTMNSPENVICTNCKYIFDKLKFKPENFAA